MSGFAHMLYTKHDNIYK